MKWKVADPIPRLRKVLEKMGVADDELLKRQERAKAVNDEALEFAIASQPPAPSTVADFVFA